MPPSSAAIDRGYLLGQLRDLIACDTQNPPGRNYGAIAGRLADELRRLGLEARVVPVPAAVQEKILPGTRDFPRCNVVARRDAGAPRTLHFNAHFDVVPAAAAAGWTRGPFEAHEAGGWVYGRGAADMKGAIAALLAALKDVRDAGARPACNLEVSLVCDEESGSELGARWLVEEGLVKPDFAIVCEGGSGPRICLGHNGTVWYEVSVHGKSAHASTPERGLNAFDRACDLAVSLRRHGRRIGRRLYVSPDGFRLRPTINVGGFISSGEGAKINTVPNLAIFTIDRRVLVNETVAGADRELRAHLAAVKRKTPELRYTLRPIEKNHPCLVDDKGPLPQAVLGAVSQIRRNRPKFSVSTGFNDMYWFARRASIPVVGYGPGGDRFHGVDERTRVKDLVATAAVYAHLMRTFAG